MTIITSRASCDAKKKHLNNVVCFLFLELIFNFHSYPIYKSQFHLLDVMSFSICIYDPIHGICFCLSSFGFCLFSWNTPNNVVHMNRWSTLMARKEPYIFNLAMGFNLINQHWKIWNTRSLGALRALTSSWRPLGPLDFDLTLLYLGRSGRYFEPT